MINKRFSVVMLFVLAAALGASGCSFGKNEPEEQVIIQETPTPSAEPAVSPTPTPTPAPDLTQSVTYTSADKSLSVELPNVTWANRTDENGTINFESPDEGKLLILHGQGDDLNSMVIPDNKDLAQAMEGDLTAGTDYEILGYANRDEDTGRAITYTVRYLNTQASEGVLYKLYRMFTNDSEYYNVEATVKNEEALDRVTNAVNSIRILSDSSLKSIVASTNEMFISAVSSGNVSDGITINDSGVAEASRDFFTQEQIDDRNQTRTIYRNSDGKALVIYVNSEGLWSDGAGNTYHFENNEDVYDQNDVDYYYHGESASVYFMSPEDEE